MIAWPWGRNKTALLGEMFREYLAQADRRVRATKTHIYNQERLIERLADEGRNIERTKTTARSSA
jgi:hypothetical protein